MTDLVQARFPFYDLALLLLSAHLVCVGRCCRLQLPSRFGEA
jgi:hypothetical protein